MTFSLGYKAEIQFLNFRVGESVGERYAFKSVVIYLFIYLFFGWNFFNIGYESYHTEKQIANIMPLIRITMRNMFNAKYMKPLTNISFP